MTISYNPVTGEYESGTSLAWRQVTVPTAEAGWTEVSAGNTFVGSVVTGAFGTGGVNKVTAMDEPDGWLGLAIEMAVDIGPAADANGWRVFMGDDDGGSNQRFGIELSSDGADVHTIANISGRVVTVTAGTTTSTVRAVVLATGAVLSVDGIVVARCSVLPGTSAHVGPPCTLYIENNASASDITLDLTALKIAVLDASASVPF